MARRKRGPGQWGQNTPYVSPWQGGSGSTSAPSGSGSSLSPAAAGPQELPPDSIYTSDVGAINLNYDQTMAGIAYDQTALAQQYGFDAQGNLDPSNPYSVAANLQRRYQQGQRGTTNSMAAAGQLYAGAHQRNLDEGTYQYSRSYDTAKRAAMGGYQDLTEKAQAAEFAKAMGISEAEAARILRAQGN